MRVFQSEPPLHVRAVAGTHVVLMALNLDENARPGLRGFAIKRGTKGRPQEWLTGIKYFADLVTEHRPGDDYSSRAQPFQTFLWSDYRAAPGTDYEFTIVALYGPLQAMEERYTVAFSISTEREFDQGHGVWFNRGAIASHAFEKNFQNKRLTPDMANAVSDQGKLLDDEARWLSRGLLEACLKFINDAKAGEGLRVCAYEFTYAPVLNALKRALDRGVDVQIIYHDTKRDDDPNRLAIAAAQLPSTAEHDGTQLLYPRTKPKTPHNKFIVKIKDGSAAEVWTGSTNFTDTGFLGQTNVGHLVAEASVAATYLEYWQALSSDPVRSKSARTAASLTPNPANAIEASSVKPFFSPRKSDDMLKWYGQRVTDATGLVMMTIPFNVADAILSSLDKPNEALRLVILEDVPTLAVTQAERRNRGRLAFSNGAILGQSFIKYHSQSGGAKVTPIPNSDLDHWFVEEELARATNKGHVFFVHSKVLLIDPLSDDPLVCSGSANFSPTSLKDNDENMLLIRGNTRVADIYMTEVDRIFRHFFSRDIINHSAAEGDHKNFLLLDPTDSWIEPNFRAGTYKNNRRLLFFPPHAENQPGWIDNARRDPDPFTAQELDRHLTADGWRLCAETRLSGLTNEPNKERGAQLRVQRSRPSR